MRLTDFQVQGLLRLAYQYAAVNSDDPNTQVGAVIVIPDVREIIFGTNKFVHPKFNTPENLQRARKYNFVEHAERAVIFEAARLGHRLEGAILVCPWAACGPCARAIVLAGIRWVYAHEDIFDKTPNRWLCDIAVGAKILESAGVDYIRYSGKIGDCTNLFDGKTWKP